MLMELSFQVDLVIVVLLVWIDAIEYARTNKVPLLGICLGMQLITIEYARNVCGIKDANSLEFDELCKNPVINLMSINL